MREDLIDQELFGNEAGEDEDIEVLSSYFLEKPIFDSFYSRRSKLGFVRSKKGMGKSALLKQTYHKREKEASGDLLIYVKASDLFSLQEVRGDSPSDLISGWQQRISSKVNIELSGLLRLNLVDDKHRFVDGSEITSFGKQNLAIALIERLKAKGFTGDLDKVRMHLSANSPFLNKVFEKKDPTVWVFVDDIDATFVNTPAERLKVSTFFSACRDLTNLAKGVCLRASVRTDVWSILAQHDEALDKCEQYMVDLHWSTTETGQILANKIHSFFVRTYPEDAEINALRPELDSDKIRQLVFKEPFSWGANRYVEAFRPIHILSAGRPRWAAQLCKLAGNDAYAKGASHISIKNVQSAMQKYGQFRIADLYKEHRHQCERLENLIEYFSGGKTKYTTDELLAHITDKIIRHRGLPKIDGIPAEGGSISVAHFLFRIGFIAARDENDPTGLVFIQFEQRPNLLTTTANLDDNLVWEIHPSYRNTLRIQSNDKKSGEESIVD